MHHRLIIAAALAFCASATHAQTVSPTPPQNPQQTTGSSAMQAPPTGDRTGTTQRDASGAMGGGQFNTLDTDGNGSLSETELAGMAGGLGADGYTGVDSNGDGRVSPDEFRRFEAMRGDTHGEGRHGTGATHSTPVDDEAIDEEE